MTTVSLWLNGVLQGTENDLNVNLEMRSSGDIYWVPDAGAKKKISGVEAVASATEAQNLVLNLNLVENGGEPVLQKVIGVATQDGAEAGVSWAYDSNGVDLKFGLPINGPSGQAREAQWDCVQRGSPGVVLKVIVRRTAPTFSGLKAPQDAKGDPSGRIVITRVEIQPGADPNAVSTVMAQLDNDPPTP